MCGQFTAAKDRIKALITKLADAELVLEELANESSKTKTDPRAKIVAAEKSYNAEKAGVERF